MDHEDPINHLKKFYEIVKSLVASDIEEESLYLSLFRHVLIERVKVWYLDQSAIESYKFEHSRGQVHQKVLYTELNSGH